MSIREIDVLFQDVPLSVCCFVDEDEGWLVDPGPESCHRTLLAALGDWKPERILLTHIHFDHAGATGALLRTWGDVEVWVHERGAKHLADPERLVASARRIYGDAFDTLWGEVVPIPADRLRVVSGGEADHGFRVEYTPGHASHHVSYLHEATGTAFVGDVGGVRIGEGPTLPPTPPPDIDVELWQESLRKVAAWEPAALACTHFGRFTDVAEQIETCGSRLARMAELAREVDAEEFARVIEERVAATVADPGQRTAYLRANPPDTLWSGLDRYWSKKAAAAS